MTCHIEYEVEEEAATVFLESISEISPLKFNNSDTSTGHWVKKLFKEIVVPTMKMTRKRYFLWTGL